MNYRHAYHAGNHADVFKHGVLALVASRLAEKEKPFLALDAHGGIGIYDLESNEAGKTGEWRDGVGRLDLPLNDRSAEKLLAPWRRALAAVNPQGGLRFYPGSPEVLRLALRDNDRLVVNELHPADREALETAYGFDRRVRVTGTDAMVAIKAHLPPPQRRGVTLIDPPYERRDEAEAAVRMLKEGHRRFATGIFVLWYPITGDGVDQRLASLVEAARFSRAVKVRAMVRAARHDGGLAGSGLIIVNPPWKLAETLQILLSALMERLAQDRGAHFDLAWLAGEEGAGG